MSADAIKLASIKARWQGRHSDNFVEWLKNYGSDTDGAVIARVFRLARTGMQTNDVMIVASLLDGKLRGANLTTVLACGISTRPRDLSTLGGSLLPVDDFWQSYLALGVCAIDRDHAFEYPARFELSPGLMKCRWCSHERTTIEVSQPELKSYQDLSVYRFIVYAIKNKLTGQLYIGSTNDRVNRWRQHRADFANGTHKNLRLMRDVLVNGLENFKFFVLFRFNNRQDMLAREQLVIGMYFNRRGCYNVAQSVDEDIQFLPVRMLYPSGGMLVEKQYMTIHAAIRDHGLQKKQVRNAIAEQKGRLGEFQFPINVPINQPKPADSHQMNEYLGEKFPSFNDRLSHILRTQNVSIGELCAVLHTNVKGMSLWKMSRPPSMSQRAILNLIERHGFRFVADVQVPKYDADMINRIRIRYNRSFTQFGQLVGAYGDGIQGVVVEGFKLDKTIARMIALIDHHGPLYFAH